MSQHRCVAAAMLVLLPALWSCMAGAAGQWQGRVYPQAGGVESSAEVPAWEVSDTGGSGAPDDRRDFLTDVAFADDRRGWTCGYGGVFSTHDGGATWRRARRAMRPPESWCHLELDAGGRPWLLVRLHGQADARLWRGDNAGNWTSVPTPLRGAEDFIIRDRQIWILGGMQGSLYSDDGGTHWQQLDFGGQLSGAFRMTRLDDGTLHVLGIEGGHPTLLRSRDGRTAWRRMDLPSGLTASMHGYSLHFASAGRGALGLPDGTIAVTGDAGKTWRQSVLRSGHHVTAVFVLPDGSVHAAVRNDDVDLPGLAMFYSPDMGRTWMQAFEGRMQVNAFSRHGDLLWGAGSVPGRVYNDLLLRLRLPAAGR